MSTEMIRVEMYVQTDDDCGLVNSSMSSMVYDLSVLFEGESIDKLIESMIRLLKSIQVVKTVENKDYAVEELREAIKDTITELESYDRNKYSPDFDNPLQILNGGNRYVKIRELIKSRYDEVVKVY